MAQHSSISEQKQKLLALEEEAEEIFPTTYEFLKEVFGSDSSTTLSNVSIHKAKIELDNVNNLAARIAALGAAVGNSVAVLSTSSEVLGIFVCNLFLKSNHDFS